MPLMGGERPSTCIFKRAAMQSPCYSAAGTAAMERQSNVAGEGPLGAL